jgi:uncharacterized glyoxalase superfamily protein PhnB
VGRVRLSYTTFLARDVAALATFYVEGLGLGEIVASRDERYREVRADGGCLIGFATDAVRPFVNLPEEPATGTRSLLTFNVDTVADVAPAIERAVAAGAELVRAAIETFFGQYQAVLRDPEGNIFRLSAAIDA